LADLCFVFFQPICIDYYRALQLGRRQRHIAGLGMQVPVVAAARVSLHPDSGFATPACSTPASMVGSMVGSIVPASEVSPLLLVATAHAESSN